MFIDSSFQKLFPLLVGAALITCIVAFSVMADTLLHVVPLSHDIMSRDTAELWYTLLYKIPSGATVYASTAQPNDQGAARSIPILLYHGEGATSDMPIATFLDQLRALKRDGWQTITMQDFEDFMKHNAVLPDKSFLLTFDDGRRDTLYGADPILKDLGYHAIMFVITGLSLPDEGKTQHFYLTQTELQHMVDTGRWELESHGKLDHSNYSVQSTTDTSKEAQTVDGHFMSNKFWSVELNRFETDQDFALRIKNDLYASKKTLEDVFHVHVNSYAYPFNDFGQDTVNFPGSTHILDTIVPSMYTFAFYQHWPGNGDTFNYADPNRYMVRRIEPTGSWSGNDLLEALSAGRAKDLPYETITFGQDWLGSWGKIEHGTTLTLGANPDTSGAASFLNGSRLWRDYEFSATINWMRGSDISLIARNTDALYYVACAFSDSKVTIETHKNGEQVNLRTTSYPFRGSKESAQFGIRVKGTHVTCLENGTPVASATTNDFPEGGVGIQVWNKALGVALVEVQNVSVVGI